MAFYNLRLALRHVWLRKVYTCIIVLSLAVGFTCTSLLLSFLVAEIRTDSFHTHAARTFQLFSNDPFEDNGSISPYIPRRTADYLGDTYPEVESIVQMGTLGGTSLESTTVELNSIGLLSVDSTFFSVFDFPVYAGSVTNGLTAETIMLSRDKAVALFGDDRAVGQMLTLKATDTTRTLMVSAIIDHFPENSHLSFEALVAHSVLKNKWFGGATYIILRDAAARNALQEKVNNDAKLPGLMGEGKLKYAFEPLSQSYFNEANRMTYMRTRSMPFLRAAGLVCGLILFMATFNFVSLYLLSLQERKKEAGIRKTLGVTVARLAKTCATEVAIYTFVGMVIAIVLISGALPFFNNMLETSLRFEHLSRMDILGLTVAIVFILGLLVVGFALVQQSRIKPISLMKAAGGSRIAFNRSLFTVQFMISIMLAICAVTIIRQMHFMETSSLGFNRNILHLRVYSDALAAKLPVLKNRLTQLNGVQRAAITTGSPIFGNWMARYDLEDGKFYSPNLFSGDEDLMSTLDLQLLEGRLLTPTSQGKLVNEKLVKMFDMKEPVDQLIPGTKDVIIGVVRDFTSTSFKDEIQPAIISYSTGNSRLLIDYSGSTLDAVLPGIGAAWKEVFPGEYFSYNVLQEELMKKYKDDKFLYKTVVSYAVISMVISCFGLFALSWAVAQSRMKELGIRKVLGARVNDIVKLLTISFLKRIAVAFIVAVPVAYYLMDAWLHRFVKRIPMDVATFMIAGVAVTVIALITMSVQTLRAAVSNPVNELKNE